MRREAKEGHESANELERRCDPFLRLVALLVLLSRPEASGSREGVLALLDAAQAPSLRSAASGAGQGPGPSASRALLACDVRLRRAGSRLFRSLSPPGLWWLCKAR